MKFHLFYRTVQAFAVPFLSYLKKDAENEKVEKEGGEKKPMERCTYCVRVVTHFFLNFE